MIKKDKKLLKDKKEFLFLILILILTIILRLWKILEIPVSGDEGYHSRIALEMKKTGEITFSSGVPWQGPMIIYIISPSIYLFSNNLLAFRIPIVILSILTMILFYLYVKDVYGIHVSILSLFIFTIIPLFIILSNNAVEYSPVLFFILFAIYLFHKYQKTNNNKFIYLFSFVSGLGIITRLTFLFFLFSFLLTLKINPDINHKKKRNKINFKMLLICFLFFIIGIYPMLHYNIFNDFPTAKYVLRNFPKTEFNVNIINVGTNIFKGFKMFFIFFCL